MSRVRSSLDPAPLPADAAVGWAASPPLLLRVVELLVGLVEQHERDGGDGTGHVQVGLRLHAEAARALLGVRVGVGAGVRLGLGLGLGLG